MATEHEVKIHFLRKEAGDLTSALLDKIASLQTNHAIEVQELNAEKKMLEERVRELELQINHPSDDTNTKQHD